MYAAINHPVSKLWGFKARSLVRSYTFFGLGLILCMTWQHPQKIQANIKYLCISRYERIPSIRLLSSHLFIWIYFTQSLLKDCLRMVLSESCCVMKIWSFDTEVIILPQAPIRRALAALITHLIMLFWSHISFSNRRSLSLRPHLNSIFWISENQRMKHTYRD